MLPRVFTTTFDPRSQLFVYSTRFGNRLPKTNRYSFEEIAGICLAVAAYKAGYCYFPCLKLKGPFRRLRLVRSGLTLTRRVAAVAVVVKPARRRHWRACAQGEIVTRRN